MSNPFLNKINTPAAVGFVVLVIMLSRVIHFYAAPYDILVTIIPDDAFYYLQMAKHRAFEGRWTFDGISPSTGFHFLYAHILVWIYSLFGNVTLGKLFLAISVMASISIGLAAFLISIAARNILGERAVWLTAPFFMLPIIVVQSTNMMESWLVIFFSSATIYKLTTSNKNNFYEIILLCAIGFFGSLARSDYGILPGFIFLVDCALSFSVKKFQLQKSGSILLGAIAGVLFSSINNYFIAGHFLSASSEVKYYWSMLAGHNISNTIDFMIAWLSPSYAINKFIKITIIILISVLIIIRLMSGDRFYFPNKKTELSIACALTIVGYVMLYKYNCQGIQNWYAASFISPMAILFAASIIFIFKNISFLPGALAILTYGGMGIKSNNYIPYPGGIGQMNAGLYLKEHAGINRYAAINAGIISYFSEKPVVNIDGLVNDEIVPYIKNNDVFEYLKIKKINYVAEYEVEITNPYAQLRGGYYDKRITQCLLPLEYIDGNAPMWHGTRIRVFQILDNCG